MIIDVIFLSFSKTKELYEMTKKAINSLIDNNKEFRFNICVVQTCDNKFGDEYYFGHKDIHTIHPNTEFHYNNFLRLAYNEMEHKSEVILICNDDIIFNEKSVMEMLNGTEFFFICSSKNPNSRFNRGLQSKHKSGYVSGYNNSEHFSGWCHLINKSVFNHIPVDTFWDSRFGGFFQDNWIVFLCREKGLNIGLCADSIVNHNECTSSPIADNDTYFSMSQSKIFTKAKKEYRNA